MSLNIDVDKVTKVLLADGWHPVVDESFYVADYGFSQRGGTPDIDGPAFGFKDHEEGWVQGPLSSVLAVRERTLS